MNGREVVVVSGVRTAIGDFGGALKDIPPTELGARVAKEAIARAGIEAGEVGHVVFGNVIQTEAKDMYLSRVVAMNGGVPQAAASRRSSAPRRSSSSATPTSRWPVAPRT